MYFFSILEYNLFYIVPLVWTSPYITWKNFMQNRACIELSRKKKKCVKIVTKALTHLGDTKKKGTEHKIFIFLPSLFNFHLYK